MATGRGYAVKVGAGNETTYGTGVAATQMIPIVSEDFNIDYAEIQNLALDGGRSQRQSVNGSKTVAGSLVVQARYTLSNMLLEHFFGTLSIDTPSVGINSYVMKETTEGDLITIAIAQQIEMKELVSLKLGTFTLDSSPDDVTWTFAGQAQNVLFTGQTNSDISALTNTDARLRHQDLTLRIADTVDALASPGDDIQVSELSLVVDRVLEGTHFVNGTDLVLEPVENAHTEATLTLTFPRYTLAQRITWLNAGTILQGDLVYDNSSNTKTIFLPELRVTEVLVSTDGPNLIAEAVTLRVGRDETNANMTVTGEIEMQET